MKWEHFILYVLIIEIILLLSFILRIKILTVIFQEIKNNKLSSNKLSFVITEKLSDDVIQRGENKSATGILKRS